MACMPTACAVPIVDSRVTHEGDGFARQLKGRGQLQRDRRVRLARYPRALDKHSIAGGRDVLVAVDEGAIQIKDHGPDGRPRGLYPFTVTHGHVRPIYVPVPTWFEHRTPSPPASPP